MLCHQRIKRCNFRHDRITVGVERNIDTDGIGAADGKGLAVRCSLAARDVKADNAVKAVSADLGLAADTHDTVGNRNRQIVFAVVGSGKGDRTALVRCQPHRNDLRRIRGKQRTGINGSPLLVGHGCNAVYQVKLTAVVGEITVSGHRKAQIARGFVGLDAEEIGIEQLRCHRVGVFSLPQTGTHLCKLFGKAVGMQLQRTACPQTFFVELQAFVLHAAPQHRTEFSAADRGCIFPVVSFVCKK